MCDCCSSRPNREACCFFFHFRSVMIRFSYRLNELTTRLAVSSCFIFPRDQRYGEGGPVLAGATRLNSSIHFFHACLLYTYIILYLFIFVYFLISFFISLLFNNDLFLNGIQSVAHFEVTSLLKWARTICIPFKSMSSCSPIFGFVILGTFFNQSNAHNTSSHAYIYTHKRPAKLPIELAVDEC